MKTHVKFRFIAMTVALAAITPLSSHAGEKGLEQQGGVERPLLLAKATPLALGVRPKIVDAPDKNGVSHMRYGLDDAIIYTPPVSFWTRVEGTTTIWEAGGRRGIDDYAGYPYPYSSTFWKYLKIGYISEYPLTYAGGEKPVDIFPTAAFNFPLERRHRR
jgi:hypothetical protein